jgi:hypothetical protein
VFRKVVAAGARDDLSLAHMLAGESLGSLRAALDGQRYSRSRRKESDESAVMSTHCAAVRRARFQFRRLAVCGLEGAASTEGESVFQSELRGANAQFAESVDVFVNSLGEGFGLRERIAVLCAVDALGGVPSRYETRACVRTETRRER